jgi:hypothetical protein
MSEFDKIKNRRGLLHGFEGLANGFSSSRIFAALKASASLKI